MVTLKDIVDPNTTPEVDKIIREAMRKANEDMAEVERKASLL